MGVAKALGGCCLTCNSYINTNFALHCMTATEQHYSTAETHPAMKITTVILLYTILVALIGSSIQMQEENDEYGSSQEVPQCNCVLRAQQRDCVEKVSVPHYIAFGQTSQHIDSCYRKYSKIK